MDALRLLKNKRPIRCHNRSGVAQKIELSK